jgi:3-oxoacyl-[acyl-carrier protein] reductase
MGSIRINFSQKSRITPDLLKQYEPLVPLGQLGKPNTILGAALLLASNASSYITSHAILTDGSAVA